MTVFLEKLLVPCLPFRRVEQWWSALILTTQHKNISLSLALFDCVRDFFPLYPLRSRSITHLLPRYLQRYNCIVIMYEYMAEMIWYEGTDHWNKSLCSTFKSANKARNEPRTPQQTFQNFIKCWTWIQNWSEQFPIRVYNYCIMLKNRPTVYRSV